MRDKPIGICGHLAFVLVVTIAFASVAFGQTVAVTDKKPDSPKDESAKQVVQPRMTKVRGVSLGMTASEVKQLLGDPKVDDDDGFFYVFSDNESLQVRLNEDKKVWVLSMTYSGSEANAPEFVDVFGDITAPTAGAKGNIHKLVRYPDVGYWVSYSRIVLDSGPMTTITMQKL